jgi:hypothetical protein
VRRAGGIAATVVLAGLVAGSAVWLLGRGGTPDAAAEQSAAPVVAAQSGGSSTPTPSAAPRSGTGRGEEASTVDAPDSPQAWRAVLDELYAARAEAYASASTQQLDAVYTRDSPLREADAAELARLRSSGAEVQGFAPEVVEVRSAVRTGARVDVRLVDRWRAYTVLGEDGSPQAVPARGDRPVAMVLIRGDAGWRIDTARLLP